MKVVFTEEFEKSLKRLWLRKRLAPYNPMEYYRKCKYFIQRGRRGYSDLDTYNAFEHIAHTVIAWLNHNETCQMAGWPMGISEKKWREHKAEIRWLMNEVLERDETPVEVTMTDAYKKRWDRASRIFGRYFPSLWC